jgi:serine/threonine protein kinase
MWRGTYLANDENRWLIFFTFAYFMTKRYPRQLSAGANNIVIALSETEVAKIYEGDTRSDIGSEAVKLKFANKINELVVRFIKMDFDDEHNWEMLVMERLYPMDYRSLEFEKRILLFDVFEDELKELHKKGFVHRDLNRPSNIPGDRYDNIFLTDMGLRLIDVGISALESQVGSKLFEKYIAEELKELETFKKFFLER